MICPINSDVLYIFQWGEWVNRRVCLLVFRTQAEKNKQDPIEYEENR